MPHDRQKFSGIKFIIGLVLLAISILAFFYFRYYRGTLIPYPILWRLGAIALGVIAAVILYNAVRQSTREEERSIELAQNNIREKAEVVKLEFDNCYFRDGSFTMEVQEREADLVLPSAYIGSRIGMYETPPKTKNTLQSFLIYTHGNDETKERFVSQAFPFDKTTLQFYVLNNNITLYVDRFDRKQYFFELKK